MQNKQLETASIGENTAKHNEKWILKILIAQNYNKIPLNMEKSMIISILQFMKSV